MDVITMSIGLDFGILRLRLFLSSVSFMSPRGHLCCEADGWCMFLGLYLTDVTFCREGNQSYRVSPRNPNKKLINFNKYHKLARIVQGRHCLPEHVHGY